MAAGGMQFIDIGCNLLDEMYQGEYHGKSAHEPDLDAVLERAWAAGVSKIIVTAGSLKEAEAALRLCQTDDRLFCTVGCHPTRCGEFEAYQEAAGSSTSSNPADAYLQALREVLQRGVAAGKVVAVGECGLDYDRLHFCDKDTQRKYFEAQFSLARESGLPMFLHLRAACEDFLDIVKRNEGSFVGGVVHSFDGSQEELGAVLAASPKLHVGLNGCSLKTEANLEVAATVPWDRLHLETDAPWCDIRNTHAGKRHVKTTFEAKDKKKHDKQLLVKGRNEPCTIVQVLEVVAGQRGMEAAEVARHAFENSNAMFFSRGRGG